MPLSQHPIEILRFNTCGSVDDGKSTLIGRLLYDSKNLMEDQLEALAKRARRSKSFLAAEAIAAYVEAERWQLDEIQAGLQQLDKGRGVAQKDVSKWLRSWGQKRERKAPRA